MKLTTLSKNPYFAELPFKIIYLLFGIFTFCNLTFMQPIMSFMVIAVLGFAVISFIPRFINIGGYIKTPAISLLIAFSVSFIISALLNFSYGYSDNFKGLVWLILHFFGLFACDVNRDEKEYKKEFTVISIFYLVIFFVMSAVSLIQYIINYSLEQYNKEYTRLAGLVWGRLWGVFRDPNYASVFAAITIVLSVYYIRKNKNKLLRAFLIFNIFVQFLYLCLSGSRTGMVALFAVIFLYILFIGLKKLNFKGFLKISLVVILALLISASSLLIITGVHKVNSEIVEYRYYQSSEGEDVPEYEDGREQDLESDISNRRFDLWKSGVEIFSENKAFGVSYYNLKSYAETQMPDTYLVNNNHGAFNNTHNIIFNVLAGQGITGIILFAAFAVFTVFYIFKNIAKTPDEDYEYICVMFICVISSLVCAMFVTDVIYTNSPTSVIFWLLLGYIFHYIKRKKENVKNEC
ncbi:MAG: O-antigen ligase family protein [Acutalibacteraceae bacterium]|nr:O-antigen ligase family protein [Acutalibacteraceae bacterium]